MSEADYRAYIGKWITDNHEKLVSDSKIIANKISWNGAPMVTSRRTVDNAHTLLSEFVEYLYEDTTRTKVSKIIKEDWLHKFAAMWMKANLFGGRNIYGTKMKFEHELGDYHPKYEPRDDLVLHETYLDAESPPVIVKEYLRDLYSAGYEWADIDKILLAHLAAEESLTPSEKMLFNMYFTTEAPSKYVPENKSYRGLEDKLGLDKTQLFRMVKVIERKIKNKIAEYGTNN